MSSINLMIGLTSGIFLPSFVIFYWLAGKTNQAGIEVLTGVIQGHSIPTKIRWIWLYQTWMGYALALVVLPLALGFAVVQIAERVTEADARIVGYMYAFIFFVAALVALLTGISMFIEYVARVRQAEAD